MKMTKREHTFIGLLLLVLIWGLAFRFWIAPAYGSLICTRQMLEEIRKEKAVVDLYLEQVPEMEAKMEEQEKGKKKEPAFYQDIDDVWIDRKLQWAASGAGVKLESMIIGEPKSVELPESETGNLKEWPLMKREVTVELEGRDVNGVIRFADEMYQEDAGFCVSYMDMKGQPEKAGGGKLGERVEGMMEVIFYYEKTR